MLSPGPAQTQPRTLPAEPRPWPPDPSQQPSPLEPLAPPQRDGGRFGRTNARSKENVARDKDR